MGKIKAEFGEGGGSASKEAVTGYSASTGLTYTEVQAFKIGNTVVIQGNTSVTSAKSAGDTVFTGLPAPSAEVTVSSAFSRGPDNRTVKIDTSGNAKLQTAGMSSGNGWGTCLIYDLA